MSGSGAAILLPPGFRLVAHDCLPGTNDEAARRAAAGEAAGTVVWARTQTHGRGRQDRQWSSPPGNLYISLILRPSVPPSRAAELSFVAAVAVADCVLRWLPSRRVELKWPNDVLADGAKIAGILLEAASPGTGAVDWVVIGIGLNIASAPADTPYPATALGVLGAETATVEAVLGSLLRILSSLIRRWESDGFAPIRESWLGRARGIGDPVTVRLGDARLTGTFAGLDPDGALRLDTGSAIRRITAGDVHFPGR